MLKFITGNKGKFAEVKEILAPIKIKQVNVDLHEIQELDPYKIIEHKVKAALNHESSNFMVEDTATYYRAFKGKLPGPFMRWFLEVLGPNGLYQMAKKLGDIKAEMRTVIAYVDKRNRVHFFEGRTQGVLVKPVGKYGFGLDPIFRPAGSAKTLAQLGKEKSEFSARARAVAKFKRFLLKKV